MGDGVNIAARLEGVAKPGGICLSEDAYRQVKTRLDMQVTDQPRDRLAVELDRAGAWRDKTCSIVQKREKVLLELLTNEGSAPFSTSQFDLVINNLGRLRGRQRQPCKHRDIARGFGVFQGNLCSASRKTYGYVPGQPERAGLFG